VIAVSEHLVEDEMILEITWRMYHMNLQCTLVSICSLNVQGSPGFLGRCENTPVDLEVSCPANVYSIRLVRLIRTLNDEPAPYTSTPEQNYSQILQHMHTCVIYSKEWIVSNRLVL
jgi:hypothetical protein